jgi:regulator of protease activity HflC (stomatin/prohibitin superfamily)
VPRSEIRNRVRERLMVELAGTGIEVIGAGLSNIQPDDPSPDDKPRPAAGGAVVPGGGTIVYVNAAGEGLHPAAGEEKPPWVNVTEQRVTRWGVEWQRQAAERTACGEAQATRILEHARAQVLAEFIHAVAEGFREMAATGVATPNDVIALSFVNAVEQMLTGQNAPESLGASKTRSTMQSVRRMMLLDR